MTTNDEDIAVAPAVQAPRPLSVVQAKGASVHRTSVRHFLSREHARDSSAAAAARIAACFTLFVAVIVGADQAITRGLRKINTSAYGVTNRIITGTVNADIVVSGSSRALTHYDPRIIQQVTGHSTFNIGRNASQTDLQLAVLKAYLKRNAKPKLIIHNLDLFSFVSSHEIFDPSQYVPYLGEEAIYDAVSRVYPDAWKWKFLPLYGYVAEDSRFSWILGMQRWIGIQPREDHFQGFVPRFSQWTGDFEKFRTQNPEGVNFAMEPRAIQDFTELIEICRELGVRILLVYSPVYHEMRSLERNRAEVFAKFREICDRADATIWDYSDSPVSRIRANFYNSQHLNAEGAAAFSTELAWRLVHTGVIERPRSISSGQ